MCDIADRGMHCIDASRGVAYNRLRKRRVCHDDSSARMRVLWLLSCQHTFRTTRSVAMVLLEMSITPLGKGESVSQFVAECVEIIDRSGLDYELHAMGTIVEGELDEVLDLMRRCM